MFILYIYLCFLLVNISNVLHLWQTYVFNNEKLSITQGFQSLLKESFSASLGFIHMYLVSLYVRVHLNNATVHVHIIFSSIFNGFPDLLTDLNKIMPKQNKYTFPLQL